MNTLIQRSIQLTENSNHSQELEISKSVLVRNSNVLFQIKQVTNKSLYGKSTIDKSASEETKQPLTIPKRCHGQNQSNLRKTQQQNWQIVMQI